ncbi:Hint domain-containing protein [uncultured Tateyamaria sp.]|uniref:Hint domain-containing protein n=1 Tax=uncultured Tateyamaria sp. TaxID=455651 RepID=UPI00260F0513|nr:Hint domain-containing protein [uncultured Tateyamaria sp.]
MADVLDGLIFSEFLVDNSPFVAGHDTDGDGTHNKSDEYIELQNTTGSAISLEGYQVWSDSGGLLYEFGASDTIEPGQTATIVGEYTGTPPDGFYDAGLNEGDDFLQDGEGSSNDTIYLVNPTTGDFIVFSYGDPVQPPSPPSGFTGTNQIGGGESLNSDGPNGVAFTRDANGEWAEGSPSPGSPGVACFAQGTLIATPEGERPVESLKPGDHVVTLDRGIQTIRWIRNNTHALDDAATDEKPVLIKAGALGQNLPTRDLIVSPQHRILVGGAGQLQHIFAREAFAPAKSLTSLPGIRHMNGKQHITWIHFACDQHEVVTANGCQTESLLLGSIVLDGMTPLERRAISEVFGGATTADAALNGPPARECLKVRAVQRRLAIGLKKKAQLVAKEIRKWDMDLAHERFEAELVDETNAIDQVHRKSESGNVKSLAS